MIYTNIRRTQTLKGSKFFDKIKFVKDDSILINKIEESKIIYIDTETAAKDFDDQALYDLFIANYIESGRKVTKVTEKSARKYVEDSRSKYALDPHRSEIRLVQIANELNDIFIIDLFLVGNMDTSKLFLAISNKPICGHNFKFDLKVILANHSKDFVCGDIFCTQMGMKIDAFAHVVGELKTNLQAAVKFYLDYDLKKGHGADDWRADEITAEQFDYCVEDVLYLKRISDIQIKNIEARSIYKVRPEKAVFNKRIRDAVTIIEMNFVETLAHIEMQGVPINTKALADKAAEIKKELSKLMKPFKGINTKSPVQLTDFLASKNIYVTSTGKPELVKHKEHKIVKDLLEVKELQKRLQMIEDYINIWTRPNGRIYGSYNQQRAAAGRMSAYKPNLQQIPRAIKNIFYKSTKKRPLIKADYPAIEARICAVVCEDPDMIKLFENNIDIHSYTTAKFLHKEMKDVTKDERQKGKSANFGFMFGMGAQAYIDYAFTNYGLDISMDESEQTRIAYFKTYPRVKAFHNKNSQILNQRGFVLIKTLLGRQAKVDSFTNANNYPIQGTAAEMIKLAANLFYKKTVVQKVSAKIINIVHDEIVVEVEDPKQKKQAKLLLQESMEIAADYILKQFKTKVEVEEIENVS